MAAFRPYFPVSRLASGKAMRADAVGGLNQLVANFNRYCEGINSEVLPDVMVDALKPTLELSNVYCPVDTGELRGSGYVEARKRGRASGPTAEIGYGHGGSAPYAVFVHENPALFHKPPTQYKFLQRAMDEDQSSIFQRIARGAKARMGL